MDEQRLEELTVALNRQLYAESVGLPCDQTEIERLTVELEREYQRAVNEPDSRAMALDGLADMLNTRWHQRWLDAADKALVVPHVSADGPPATWHNWRTLEQTLDTPARRRLLTEFVARSAALVPLIQERYAVNRQLYAAHGETPLRSFIRPEGLTPQALRTLALDLGTACRAPFQAALQDMAAQVFGHAATVAELHALYLNRMYEPLTPLFARRDPLADRPRKYAGAFCFPIQIPGDVRVSVRPASPHHLADMLFHEFGHAVHFAGIASPLPFADRYWLHAGTHETLATLFESLLGLPEFLRESFGLSEDETRQVRAFDRFKYLLTATWLAAAGLTVCDAWLENLDWAEIERRYADYGERFTGVEIPDGLARLDLYVSRVDPYPLGYVIAAVRVAHWLDELRAEWGARWWADARAGQAIRKRIELGGAVRFEKRWLEIEPFLWHWAPQESRQ